MKILISFGRYRHNDGTILQYRVDFENYDIVIPKYGKSMNQINTDKEAVEIPDDTHPKYPFSYNACCKKTINENYNGQLNYEMGHPGVGVVTRQAMATVVIP